MAGVGTIICPILRRKWVLRGWHGSNSIEAGQPRVHGKIGRRAAENLRTDNAGDQWTVVPGQICQPILVFD